MRAIIQKVINAQVDVITEKQSANRVAEIQQGLLVFLGVTHEDDITDSTYIADKIANLRIFEDEADKLNLSVQDIGGHILLVSQFTLYGDARNGRRPSFTAAAKPEHAQNLYHVVTEKLRAYGLTVQTGQFRTHMHVHLTNDGPVTLLLDSKKQF